jgi:hypothetical protein
MPRSSPSTLKVPTKAPCPVVETAGASRIDSSSAPTWRPAALAVPAASAMASRTTYPCHLVRSGEGLRGRLPGKINES